MNEHFITNIKINKLRHLENINIDISQEECKHLLLTGKNGVGKTSTLEEIKKWLNYIQSGGITLKDIEYWKNEINKINKQLQKADNVEKEILLKNEAEKQKNLIENYSTLSLDVMGKNIDSLVPLYAQGKFILAYYGADRKTIVQIPHGVEEVKLKDKYSFEDNPGNIFVKYLVDLKTQQAFARNEGDTEVVENIEAWFNRLEDALKIILDDQSISLKFNYRNYDFLIMQNNREPYGLNELSSGYSSIINIVSDLILRMDKNRAGEVRTYAFDTEGIVLIDEIETHLHIELQKKILPFLTSFFPNIQFIVSTHSPFVLNSIDNAVIYDLEKKIRVENLSAYSYDGIVEGYFEIDNYSDELKEKINEYKNLVFRDDLNNDEKARRAELRIELKNASNDLAKELKSEFNDIEEKRKKQK